MSRSSIGIVLALAACATVPESGEQDARPPVIREIRFEGVKRFTHEELLEYLAQGETTRLPWGEVHEYSEGLASEDADRLRRLYSAYGYHGAEVSLARVEPLQRRPGDVRIVFAVREGEPTRVRRIDLSWSADSPAREEAGRAVRLREGQAFELSALNDSVAALRGVLLNAGHALARVDERAEVSRELRRADVWIAIDPGPVCRVGEVRLTGLKALPADLVHEEAAFAEGQRFSPALLRSVEARLFGMGVFGAVSVHALPANTEQGIVDLQAQLTEAPLQRLKVGAGVRIESNRWDGHAILNYSHASPFGRLYRLDLGVRAGYAVLPVPWNPQEHGPIAEVAPRLRKKGLLEPELVWTLDPSFHLGVEEGYQYYSPRMRLGVSRFLWGITLAEFSYNAEFHDFFDLSPVFGQNRTQLGPDFRDPFFNSFLELGYTVFLADRMTDPRNGVVLDAVYDLAGQYLGGQFDFHKITPTLRAYWQPVDWLQLAARARVGFVLPYGDGGAPITMKLFLGGGDTVRGWGLKRLAPRIEECDADGDCRTLPVGGNTLVLGNLEVRISPAEDFWIVLFGDAGDVQPGEAEIHPEQWSYSTGGGLRYDSPVGRIRLDFGYRLNDSSRFPENERWAIHIGLGEMF